MEARSCGEAGSTPGPGLGQQFMPNMSTINVRQDLTEANKA